MAVAEIDGEIAAIVAHRRNGKWELAHAVRLRISARSVDEISDYYACPWVLPAASSVRILHPIGGRLQRL